MSDHGRIRAPMSLYVPGSSWLHRAPPWGKLLALVLAGGALVLWGGAVAAGAALIVGVGVILGAGIPARELWRQLKPAVVLVALLTLFQVVIGRAAEGGAAAVRLLAVATIAVGVTATTRPSEMVDQLERTLTRARVSPRRVFRAGLAVGLSLRSIEYLAVVAQRVLDARRARGLQRSVRAFAVPAVIAAARHAHAVGEALDARGIADPDLTRLDGPA